MNEYLFDVTLVTSLRLKARTEMEAREILAEILDCASINCGALPNGDPLLGEASMGKDAPALVEVNGEFVNGN